MNIFIRELKANLRSLVIWGVIVVLFVLVGVSKFSAYYNNPDMLSILNNLPSSVVDAMDLRAFNLTTVSGFFGIMFTYFALLLCIAATMWGSDIITKEERDKTVEYSLTLPVTRNRLVTAKTLAALVNCFGLLLITWGCSTVGAAAYQPDTAFYRFLALCMAALFILQLVFLSLGILLGCALKRYKQAGTAAISLLLAAYFLSVITTLNSSLDFLKYFSPFKYFDPVALLHESRFDFVSVALSVAIVIASMAGAYLTYAKRDMAI